MNIDLENYADYGCGPWQLFTLRSGEIGITCARKHQCDGGPISYSLRYESGWYVGYTRDGKREDGNTRRDIMKIDQVPASDIEYPFGFNP